MTVEKQPWPFHRMSKRDLFHRMNAADRMAQAFMDDGDERSAQEWVEVRREFAKELRKRDRLT